MKRTGGEEEAGREKDVKDERAFLWTCGHKSRLTGTMKTGGGVFLFERR